MQGESSSLAVPATKDTPDAWMDGQGQKDRAARTMTEVPSPRYAA